MRSHVLAAIPYPIQLLVGLLAYRTVTQTLYGQGTSRFSNDELHAFKSKIWKNVDALLTESTKKRSPDSREPFWIFGGSAPTEADTVVFGFVIGGIISNAYVQRLQASASVFLISRQFARISTNRTESSNSD